VVDVAIKKVSQRDGKDRFVLVNAKTREVVTVHDVSEATIRRYFRGKGASEETINGCLAKARKDFGEGARKASVPANDAQETMGDDDLLFELGLNDDD
jgi:fructose-1-phosphate kinase PfkB-like protein